MLYSLFSARSRLEILYYLNLHDTAFIKDMRIRFSASHGKIQEQLNRMEKDKIVSHRKVKGRTPRYFLNPRYPLLKELKALLKKGFSLLPDKEKQVYIREYIPYASKRS
jgi:predicted transcriptional regulator